MAGDTEDLVLSISADVRQMQRALDRMIKDSKIATDAVVKNVDNIGKGGGRAASAVDKASKDIARSMSASRSAAQNLSFQLNDIATQLASGTSPLTVMAQQGGQVAQALNSAGGLKGALSALGGAITGLLNPVGLLSVALIGVTGYAVQYFAQMMSSGEASNEVIKEQAQLIERVAQRWGDVIPAVRTLADEFKRAADEQDRIAARSILDNRATAPTKSALPDIQSGYGSLVGDLRISGLDSERITELQAAFANLTAKIAANKVETQDLVTVQNILNGIYAELPIQPVQDMLTTLEQFAPTLDKSAAALEENAKQFNIVDDIGGKATDMAAALAAQLIGLGPDGAGAVQQVTTSILDGLIPALGSAQAQVANLFGKIKALEASSRTKDDEAFPASMSLPGSIDITPERRVDPYFDAPSSRGSKGGSRKTAISEADREREAVRKLIEQLDFERSLIGMTDVEREKANALRRAGAAATDEQKAKIAGLTEQIYLQKQAHEAAEEATKRQQEALNQLGQIGQDALNGIVGALEDGKISGEEFVGILGNIIQQLMNMPSGGFGGILSSLFGGGGFGSGWSGATGPWGKLPGFASGTNYAPGGMALVGERGPEIVNLPRGSQVIPNIPTMKALNRGGGISAPISISIDARGADREGLGRVEAQLAKLKAELPATIVSTVRTANKQNVKF